MSRISMLLLGLMVLAGGCSAYIGDYEYVPRPAIAQVPTTEPQAPPAATAWATVEGVRRADRDAGIPFSVEVHFQLQNTAPEVMNFDPRTLVLSDGSMINFLPPAGVPVQVMSIAPGQSVTLVVYFPFLPGSDLDNMKMSPLTLRWAEQIGGQVFPQSVYFTRIFPYYYSPYWGPAPYPPVFITGSFVYVHRR
jgi:hypothetical protein